MSHRLLALVVLSILLAGSTARADAPPPPDEDLAARLARVEKELAALKKAQATAAPPPAATTPEHAGGGAGVLGSLGEAAAKAGVKAVITVGGYAEVFYDWNFRQPWNSINNFRGFDDRHNSFTISNGVLDASGTLGPVTAHVVLQVGLTPETYYLQEPISIGTNAAGTTGPNVWKFFQQLNVAWTAPVGRGLTVDAGIFLSPIGPEGMAIKDQWNWSRSNLFFGLPFYHTGFRIAYPFTDRITVSLQFYNGWNSVVDNNAEKSICGQFTYTITDRLTYNFLFFTGVERPTGAPEGRAWRTLFDTYLSYNPKPWLSLLFHFDGGFEPNNFGTSAWAAGALYLRAQPISWLYLALRGDYFYEWIPSNSAGTATPIFWNGSNWISEFTGTLDFRPAEKLSFRIEYRHDQSQIPLFFTDIKQVNLMNQAVPTTTEQDTLTIGAVAWF
jgi:hypothetical protein